jgi:hypothetical protein
MINKMDMKNKFQDILFRPLKRWGMSIALTALAVCFTLPVSGQETQSEWDLIAGNESVMIEWSGLDITSIAVEGTDRVIDRPVSPCVITGLTNGQLYRFILNQPETATDNLLVGTWIPVRDEGYEGQRRRHVDTACQRDLYRHVRRQNEKSVCSLNYTAHGINSRTG